MGGTQSVTQVQEVVQTRIMNVVSDVLVSKNTTVDQETSGAQVIRNVTVGMLPPNYCPAGTAPGAYDFRNEKTINLATVINMANVNTNELCSAIKQDLEQQAESAIKSDKSGTLAVGDNTSVEQSFKISDTTMTNLQSKMEMKMQTGTRPPRGCRAHDVHEAEGPRRSNLGEPDDVSPVPVPRTREPYNRSTASGRRTRC
jgi:hypothetical protein